MSIKLGDTAPNFQAESSLGILIFIIIWEIPGEFYFHIRQIIHRSVLQN